MAMNYNDVLCLAKAGFNAQQIGALMQLEKNQGMTTQQAQQLDNNILSKLMLSNLYGSQVTKQPDIVSGLENPYNPMQQQIDALTQQVSGLTQSLQIGNIAASQQPDAETTDDILAAIILPPNQGGVTNAN